MSIEQCCLENAAAAVVLRLTREDNQEHEQLSK